MNTATISHRLSYCGFPSHEQFSTHIIMKLAFDFDPLAATGLLMMVYNDDDRRLQIMR